MTHTAFTYSQNYHNFDYGAHHPLKISRLRLTYDLMKEYGLLDLKNCIYEETRAASDEELAMFHRQGYLDALKLASEASELADLRRYNLGPGDNPAFPGLFEWSRLSAGATVQCADLLIREKAHIAFNIAGGLHHAHDNQASGFCYVNDPVLGIMTLLKAGGRVLYIDVDAHHGDGVQWAFYHDNRVLTVSFHQHGRSLFPGTGFVNEMGEGKGHGYSVNVPLLPHTDDDVYVEALKDLLPHLADRFAPDFMVTQLGVDSFHTDPLANLDLTTNGFVEIVKILKSFDLPWLALGGGGYHTVNVARAWTLAWAEMNDVKLDNDIPEHMREMFRSRGFVGRYLHDEPFASFGRAKEQARIEAREAVSYIKKNIMPLIQ